jgi:hypothetical protein
VWLVNNELEKMWKEAVLSQFALREWGKLNIHNQVSQCPGPFIMHALNSVWLAKKWHKIGSCEVQFADSMLPEGSTLIHNLTIVVTVETHITWTLTQSICSSHTGTHYLAWQLKIEYSILSSVAQEKPIRQNGVYWICCCSTVLVGIVDEFI